MRTVIIIYLLAISVVAFAAMGIDKAKAKARAWRIPEATLFLFAILGGSPGAILGMFTFRHKTRHWYFRYGLPAILLLQLGAAYLIVTYVI